ncbi:methionine--tRNA ligase subunit beta [Candidatus Micrarchaeota archaeon]|nr:methionine--tRNA ligase subunit beta [Candidatus Micrarchaeota archaeon]
MDLIRYDDFSKLELRVGQIISSARVEGSDKLVKLSVDIGEEAPRTLVAGIGKVYTDDQLTGRKIIVLCNLAPKKLKGIESNGMLLAAGESADDLALLSLSHEMPVGTRIY